MVSKTVKVADKMGFHMRPANIFVTEMSKFSSEITLVAGEKKINGKSIMNIMAACIKYGTEVTIECSGDDENEMLEKAASMIESGMDE
ncbi:MAG: HPr family phosphocarrier protein [Clostridiales bacterium]|nr:HPr family phosphocarrier protein [Clostridiales bacterium]